MTVMFCRGPFFPLFHHLQVERLAAVRKIQRQSSSCRHEEDGEGPPPSPCEPFPPISSGDRSRNHATGGLRRPSEVDMPTALEMSPHELGGSSALDPSNPDRAWLYQTCSEFGFYQASWGQVYHIPT